MSTLELITPRIAVVDENGMITRDWYRFFQLLYVRAGGSSGSSNQDLSASTFEDSGIEELKATTYAMETALQLSVEVASLRAELDTLRTQLAGLQAGITL